MSAWISLYKIPHLYEFSIHKLKSLLKNSGFQIKSVTGIGFRSPKLKIPLWLGSDIIKYMYKKIKNVELKSGYGNPISLQFDVISNPWLNKIYFKLRWKMPWLLLMEIFEYLGKYIPFFSSNLVIICGKE